MPLHCGHSVIIVTPAFLENTLPQDLQIRNSPSVAIREQVHDIYFRYRKNPDLVLEIECGLYRYGMYKSKIVCRV